MRWENISHANNIIGLIEEKLANNKPMNEHLSKVPNLNDSRKLLRRD